jgi:hypothetical protein
MPPTMPAMGRRILIRKVDGRIEATCTPGTTLSAEIGGDHRFGARATVFDGAMHPCRQPIASKYLNSGTLRGGIRSARPLRSVALTEAL